MFILMILVAFICLFVDANKSPPDAILLSDVHALTLYSGQRTAGRRTSPVPQLNCIGGSAATRATELVQVVQCLNKGFDGRDYQWECSTELPKEVRLGRLSVSCEGYAHRDDPYVLVGSCGLEYHLEYTQRKIGHPPPDQPIAPVLRDGEKKWAPIKGFIAFVCVILFLLFMMRCLRVSPPRTSSGTRSSVTSDLYYTPTKKHIPQRQAAFSAASSIAEEPHTSVVHHHYATTHLDSGPSLDTLILANALSRPAPTPIVINTAPKTPKQSHMTPVKHVSIAYGDTKRREETSEASASSNTTPVSSWFSSSSRSRSSSHASPKTTTSTSYGGTSRR